MVFILQNNRIGPKAAFFVGTHAMTRFVTMTIIAIGRFVSFLMPQIMRRIVIPNRAEGLSAGETTHFAVILFLPCCLVSLLTGCQQLGQPWHLTASKNSDTVQLCLSNELNCPQPEGVSPAGISVYRYDSTHDNELVWDAEPDNPIINGRISGVVTYGIPPKNWTNKLMPPALVCGKAYLVNPGANFFALKCDGSVVVFDFLHLDEFFRQEDPPEPTKKRPG